MTESSSSVPNSAAPPPEAGQDVLAQNQKGGTNNIQVEFLVDREKGGLAASALHSELERVAEISGTRLRIPVLLQVFSAWAKESNLRSAILENKNTNLADQVAKVSEENAALKAANTEREKHDPIVHFSMIAGSIVIAIGLDQLKSENWGPGWVLVIIGITLTIAAMAARQANKR